MVESANVSRKEENQSEMGHTPKKKRRRSRNIIIGSASRHKKMYNYNVEELDKGAATVVVDLAKAYEKLQLKVVLAWTTHVGFPQRTIPGTLSTSRECCLKGVLRICCIPLRSSSRILVAAFLLYAGCIGRSSQSVSAFEFDSIRGRHYNSCVGKRNEVLQAVPVVVFTKKS